MHLYTQPFSPARALLALLALLFYAASPAAAQALKPWAGVGPVKYAENTAALTTERAGLNGATCATLGDGICVGTVYARNTHTRPETWWLTWERTGDLRYWTDAARLARRHGLLLKIRLAPLLVWPKPGHPNDIRTWGRGWLDTRHGPSVARYQAWARAVRDAVEQIWPHVIYDAAMPGRCGEPRLDDVEPGPMRTQYQDHSNRMLRIHAELYGINRLVVFLYSSTHRHPKGRDYGHDYLDAVAALGYPAGSRQDGFGSYAKYAEFQKLKTHPLGRRLLSDAFPTWFEQWGGSIQAWHTDNVVTRIGPPATHLDRAARDYGAASVAFMGWSVRQGPHATQNYRDVRAYWNRAMRFGPAQIRAMFARIA